MKRFSVERVLLTLLAPVLALAAAFIITSVVLIATGKDPFTAFWVMFDYGTKSDSQVFILNKATTYYLAGLAVAIGFRMNLFNIGVDGQYRLAAFFAAAVGGALELPVLVHIPLIILVAMLVGAMWASIAALLKVYRGVSEVISTIMLNSLATSFIGYLLVEDRLAVLHKDTNSVSTQPLPESAQFFSFDMGADGEIWGFILVSALAGLGFWFLLGRTRFGFDLRAVGRSEEAAKASGVGVKRMVITSMALSGAIAGLTGLPLLLNDSHQFTSNFPTGIGFTGIAIALLGRNNPVGIAFAALLWGFLERGGNRLEFHGYDKEIVGVMQGVIVLCVVIAYELVRRYSLKSQQRMVGAELAAAGQGPEGPGSGPGGEGPGGGGDGPDDSGPTDAGPNTPDSPEKKEVPA